MHEIGSSSIGLSHKKIGKLIARIDVFNWRRLGFSESTLVQDMTWYNLPNRFTFWGRKQAVDFLWKVLMLHVRVDRPYHNNYYHHRYWFRYDNIQRRGHLFVAKKWIMKTHIKVPFLAITTVIVSYIPLLILSSQLYSRYSVTHAIIIICCSA